MKIRRLLLFLILIFFLFPYYLYSFEPPPADILWVEEPDFWIATAANIAGIGLFVSRVHFPDKESVFGYTTQLLGIPALISGVLDLSTGSADASTLGMFTYAGWAALSSLVDHIFKINYRDPVRPDILIPYVVLYYLGIGAASATQLENGYAPWIIAGSTCILTVAASFYARAKGAD